MEPELNGDDHPWVPEPGAARFLADLVARARARSSVLERLAAELEAQTGGRLLDFLDHLAVPSDELDESALVGLGFVAAREGPHPPGSYVHGRARLPPITASDRGRWEMALRVDDTERFLLAQGSTSGALVRGEVGGPLRTCRFFSNGDVHASTVERHGAEGIEPAAVDAATRARAADYRQALLVRDRGARTDDEVARAFERLEATLREAQRDLGEPWACAIFFGVEREHWESRNRAARRQGLRQRAAGVGWSNHDHHTFRSSRSAFHWLVSLMECLGLRCRERFYAGAEAGWGAQVMERPHGDLLVFADVDLGEREIEGDFAHEPLAPRESLGTVGLWCALHGESALGAGLHHLAIGGEAARLRATLREDGVATMAPFTQLPELEQAFTEPESWPVDEAVVDALVARGAVDATVGERLKATGAPGSHVEIIERRMGYRGFDQRGVSDIIRRTDPRNES